LELNVHKLL
jgi:hypothetical protein